MTATEQLARMRDGHRRWLEACREAHHNAQVAYCTWCREESAAYEAFVNARNLYGRDDPATLAAKAAWRAVGASMPVPPPDSAWDRSVGMTA